MHGQAGGRAGGRRSELAGSPSHLNTSWQRKHRASDADTLPARPADPLLLLPQFQEQLLATGRRGLRGLDAAVICGSSLHDRPDLLTLSCGGGGMSGTVGVSAVRGGIFDLSFAGGWMGGQKGRAAGRHGSWLAVGGFVGLLGSTLLGPHSVILLSIMLHPVAEHAC